MKNLAGVILAFFDLAEAEGNLLQKKILQTVHYCLWFGLGILFAAVSLGLLLASCFDWLLAFMPRPLVFALTGLISGVVAIIFIWSANFCTRKKKTVTVSKPNSSLQKAG